MVEGCSELYASSARLARANFESDLANTGARTVVCGVPATLEVSPITSLRDALQAANATAGNRACPAVGRSKALKAAGVFRPPELCSHQAELFLYGAQAIPMRDLQHPRWATSAERSPSLVEGAAVEMLYAGLRATPPYSTSTYFIVI